MASRPPTPGVVSRGIGLEGLCSVLAGLWGTGTGSTSLTENVHTIAVTKMGSRKAVEVGACVLIALSLIGMRFLIQCYNLCSFQKCFLILPMTWYLYYKVLTKNLPKIIT